MALKVVDALEAVEVTDDQADGCTIGPVAAEGDVETLVDSTTVADSGQGIGVGHPVDVVEMVGCCQGRADLGSNHECKVDIAVLEAGLIGGSCDEELTPDQTIHRDWCTDGTVLVQRPKQLKVYRVRLGVVAVDRPPRQLFGHDIEMSGDVLGVDLVGRFGNFVRAEISMIQQHLKLADLAVPA